MKKQKRLAKMTVHTSKTGKWSWWTMRGGNGERMYHSQVFSRRADARRAMRRAIQIIQSGLFRVEE